MLGVALLLVALSLMNGLRAEIEDRVVAAYGHIRVTQEGGLDDANALARRIRALPEVQEAAVFSGTLALVRHGTHSAFPYLRGIDLPREQKVSSLAHALVAGRLDDLDDDSILIGEELAVLLGVRVGDQLDVTPAPRLREGGVDEIKLGRSLRVAGIFRFGWGELDANSAMGTLRAIRDLTGTEDEMQGIGVRLRDGRTLDDAAAGIARLAPGPARVSTWLESNRDLLEVLQLQKNVMCLLLFFIQLVAAFAISGGLLFAVVRKTGEIGLLAALGARRAEIAGAFCVQGVLIGLGGALGGAALAALALHYRHGLVALLTGWVRSQAMLAHFHHLQEVPASWSAGDFIGVMAGAVALAAAAGVWPAVRAARLLPAEALRNE